MCLPSSGHDISKKNKIGVWIAMGVLRPPLLWYKQKFQPSCPQKIVVTTPNLQVKSLQNLTSTTWPSLYNVTRVHVWVPRANSQRVLGFQRAFCPRASTEELWHNQRHILYQEHSISLPLWFGSKILPSTKKHLGMQRNTFCLQKNLATTKHCRFNLNCPYNFGQLKTRTITPIA